MGVVENWGLKNRLWGPTTAVVVIIAGVAVDVVAGVLAVVDMFLLLNTFVDCCWVSTIDVVACFAENEMFRLRLSSSYLLLLLHSSAIRIIFHQNCLDMIQIPRMTPGV